MFAIPKGTGVILYGEPNSKDKSGNKMLSMSVCEISDSKPLCRKEDGTFEEEGTSYWINYLVPTGTNGVGVAPYDESNGVVTFRNFGMGRIQSTTTGAGGHTSNFVGFFRLISGTMTGGKAYLKLSATEYPDRTGGEVIVIADTKPVTGYESILHYQVEYEKTSTGTPIGPETSGYWKGGINDGDTVTYGESTVARPNMCWALDSNWGDRSKTTAAAHIAIFEGEPVTNGISKTTENSLEDDVLYTVMGIKTANPTKGIYIKNGKKVVVK